MNDVIDAINTRLKSPYFGYAVLAFLALNWRGIFLLYATQGDPATRLEAFDSVTSYWSLVILPLIAGAIVAASTHWLKYFFLLAAEKPLELIENSNLEAEHKKAIRQSELEQKRVELAAARETELIERAKRDESISEIADESKKKELEKQIERIRRESDIKLSEYAKELLKAAASDEIGSIIKINTLSGQSIQAGSRSFGKGSKREYMAYDSGLTELSVNGYVRAMDLDGDAYELTHEGWELADAS